MTRYTKTDDQKKSNYKFQIAIYCHIVFIPFGICKFIVLQKKLSILPIATGVQNNSQTKINP